MELPLGPVSGDGRRSLIKERACGVSWSVLNRRDRSVWVIIGECLVEVKWGGDVESGLGVTTSSPVTSHRHNFHVAVRLSVRTCELLILAALPSAIPSCNCFISYSSRFPVGTMPKSRLFDQ